MNKSIYLPDEMSGALSFLKENGISISRVCRDALLKRAKELEMKKLEEKNRKMSEFL